MDRPEAVREISKVILTLQACADTLSKVTDVEEDLVLNAQKMVQDAADLLGSLPFEG